MTVRGMLKKDDVDSQDYQERNGFDTTAGLNGEDEVRTGGQRTLEPDPRYTLTNREMDTRNLILHDQIQVMKRELRRQTELRKAIRLVAAEFGLDVPSVDWTLNRSKP